MTGLEMNNEDAVAPEGAVTIRGSALGFAQTVEIGSHRLSADEPVGFGGTHTGPTPYDLLLAALGT
jgi:putative redox protein